MKNILVSLTLLVATAFAAAQPKDDRQPSSGMWPDGTRILWLCDLKMEGKVKILVVAPDGTTYPAELDCVPKNQRKT